MFSMCFVYLAEDPNNGANEVTQIVKNAKRGDPESTSKTYMEQVATLSHTDPLNLQKTQISLQRSYKNH